MIAFTLNNSNVTVSSSPDTPLLWVLRDELQLTGTKFGCGASLCGACTVLLDGRAVRSCTLPVQSVAGKAVTTIEGLGGDHPVQAAWIEGNVSQCGYCQPGQIMSAVALLASNPSPSSEEIKTAMAGNLCRCGTYPRIVSAIQSAANNIATGTTETAWYDATTRRTGSQS